LRRDILQWERRLKKLETELPENLEREAKKRQEMDAKVAELRAMHVYRPMWIREQDGIHDPYDEAIDRYFLKKRKEREDAYD
jgi:hypothetical protein